MPGECRVPFVLIVDDVADNRDLYAHFLTFAKLRVQTASSAEEAFEQLEVEAADIVVMDLALPGMDGWEATRRIRADARFEQTAIIVVTGHVLEEHLQRARAAGADEVLTKPCLPIELLQKILAYLPEMPAVDPSTFKTDTRRKSRP